MRKWILIYTVPMHQSTSGLMEQTCVHRNARNIQTKGRLPYVSGHHPWRKELCDVLQGEECQTHMLIIQMTQAVTDGALPNRAPLDRAAPQLTRPRPIRSSLHIWGKTLAHCVEMPGLTDDEHLYGGAPLPSPVAASF